MNRMILLISLALVMVAVPAFGEPSLTVLHTFKGLDGANPYAGLIRDSEGNLYGTTYFGGDSGDGLVFELSPIGEETVLHSFAGGPDDGQNPWAGLIRDTAGNLYGVTKFGGTSGNGIVFMLDPEGSETVLHNFRGIPTDGSTPYGNLLQDSVGNLYGTTYAGGRSDYGVIFRLDTTGHETVLHHFTGNSDGGNPAGELVQDKSGTLYGTASLGGASSKGVVFKLTTTGTLTVLRAFAGQPKDGAGPFAGLLLDAVGNLYGTTETGGASDKGVIFRVDAAGNEILLHSFTGSPADGAVPYASLIHTAGSNVSGTTYYGGSSGLGTIFSQDTTGKLTVLYNFTGGTDGATPAATLVRGPRGRLYGTTAQGGGGGVGVVFRLTP